MLMRTAARQASPSGRACTVPDSAVTGASGHSIARLSRCNRTSASATGWAAQGCTLACTLARMAAYDWPGNVRELKNLVERSLILGWFDLGPEPDSAAGVATGKPVFIIGGAPIYEAAWPYCERFYLTRIEGSFAGDTPLPASIPFDRWRVVSETRKTYRERRSGVDVVCRFIEYQQDNPRALP